MNNIDVIEKDALQLCLHALTKQKADSRDNYFSIAMESGEDTIVYSEPETVLFLEKLGIIYDKGTNWLVNNANNHAKGFLVIRFNFEKAKKWIDQQNNKLFPQVSRIDFPSTWKWFDKSKGEYQFGSKIIKFRGNRLLIFRAFMNIYERSPYVSVVGIKQKSGLHAKTSAEIRIDLNGMNYQLRKIGLEFNGKERNGYTLRNLSPKS